jgi:hypothetical protein
MFVIIMLLSSSLSLCGGSTDQASLCKTGVGSYYAIFCDGFSSWHELNSYLDETPRTMILSNVNLKPEKPIALTSKLNMTALINVFGGGIDSHLSSVYTPASPFVINLLGIDGLDLAPWTDECSYYPRSVQIEFEQSRIEFNTDKTDCSASELLTILTQTPRTLFNSVAQVAFNYNNKYPSSTQRPICPYMFFNASLNFLQIFSQVDAILISNLWQFQPYGTRNETSVTTISSRVYSLFLQGFGFTLDTSLLHPLVFEFLETVLFLFLLTILFAIFFSPQAFLFFYGAYLFFKKRDNYS